MIVFGSLQRPENRRPVYFLSFIRRNDPKNVYLCQICRLSQTIEKAFLIQLNNSLATIFLKVISLLTATTSVSLTVVQLHAYP